MPRKPIASIRWHIREVRYRVPYALKRIAASPDRAIDPRLPWDASVYCGLRQSALSLYIRCCEQLQGGLPRTCQMLLSKRASWQPPDWGKNFEADAPRG